MHVAANSGGAAGVSHDNLRAQTHTFEGSGLQKHHQNSTRRHPERDQKSDDKSGRGKKKEGKFGWSGGGGVRRRGSGGGALNTPTAHTHTHTG